MDVTGALTEKLGPLPAWAWGLGIGGGILAARAVMARRSESAAAPADVDSELAAAEAAAGGSGGGAAGVPSAAPNPGAWNTPPDYPTSTSDPSAPAAYTDNNGWRAAAVVALVKSTGRPASELNDALVKVLAGQAVTPAEENVLNRAVAALGLPPEGYPAIVRATSGVGQQVETPTGPVAGTQNPTLYRVVVWWAGADDYKGAEVARYEAVTAATAERIRDETAAYNASLPKGPGSRLTAADDPRYYTDRYYARTVQITPA